MFAYRPHDKLFPFGFIKRQKQKRKEDKALEERNVGIITRDAKKGAAKILETRGEDEEEEKLNKEWVYIKKEFSVQRH
ncbi:hypothetical protein L596_011360 [Steinernema carpocapsae]|uniref:Uncharacterized protein n=1 Tax=Steinernema carpocapsae TaxID=34508 RepID=A0A4U5NUL1_STECR|nr:hypothetical protein L596_011360 [Steinernema carpocapsae]